MPRLLTAARSRAVPASLGTALLFTLAACSTAGPNGRWEDLPNDGSVGTLAEVYDLDWTQAVIACPYETPAQLRARTGEDWKGPDLSDRDDVQVVVLLDQAGVVGRETVARTSVDLCREYLGDLAPDTPLQVHVEDGTAVVLLP